jgi:hypothetical protein
MAPDPKSPLNELEKAVFGSEARRHPVTGFPIETGIGAASDDQQVLNHLRVIYETEGRDAARAMELKLLNVKPKLVEASQ